MLSPVRPAAHEKQNRVFGRQHVVFADRGARDPRFETGVIANWNRLAIIIERADTRESVLATEYGIDVFVDQLPQHAVLPFVRCTQRRAQIIPFGQYSSPALFRRIKAIVHCSFHS